MTTNTQRTYNIELAGRVGIPQAVLIEHIASEIRAGDPERTHTTDGGGTYTRGSLDLLADQLPEVGGYNIRRYVVALTGAGYLVRMLRPRRHGRESWYGTGPRAEPYVQK